MQILSCSKKKQWRIEPHGVWRYYQKHIYMTLDAESVEGSVLISLIAREFK